MIISNSRCLQQYNNRGPVVDKETGVQQEIQVYFATLAGFLQPKQSEHPA